MTAAEVDASIAKTLENVLDDGKQPSFVRVSIEAYRALAARDELEPAHIGAAKCDTLRARLLGFELPVLADRNVPAGDAWIYGFRVPQSGVAS